jgi:anti-sigma factor RsiW
MTHLTTDVIERWQRGELPPREVLELARHLASCRDCRAIAEPRDLERRVTAIREQVEELEHPDLETELFAYVDGTLEEPRRERVAEHLLLCSRCREDVDDARSVSRPPRRAPSRVWLIAVAALLAVVFAGALLQLPSRFRKAPLPEAPRAVLLAAPPRPPVDEPAAARGAIVEAPLAMPKVLRSLRGGEDVLRGEAGDRVGLSPVGVVVESQRPRLTWEAPDGARSVVVIYAGERELTRSPSLRTTSWTPHIYFERGMTYTWEVQIQTRGDLQIVPSPPAPAARFHVLDARTAEELENARAEHAGDPLLLGVLYARAGLEERARAELGRVGGPEREVAQQRLREIDAWSR